jgi:Ulp1 family protease
MRNAYRTERAKKLMEKFYDIFKEFFGTSRRFIFQEAQDCPQQLDGSSCGIYVACNVADLLAGAKPRTTRLTEDEIRGFRRKGLKLLKAAQPVQFQEYNS